jgi:TniQ
MLNLYPDWSLTCRVVPPRSRLYHLTPVGVGTEHVESLTSYVTRLAAAHAVPVSKLVSYEIGPVAIRPKLRSQFARDTQRRVVPLNYRQSYILNASGSAAENWVTQLSHLTGDDKLRFLTALCWNEAVSGEELVRWHHAWCPQCYQGWRDSGEMVREPLLWVLRTVKVCAPHRRQLETRCRNCGRTPHVLTGTSRSGYCGHCQAWLGSNEPGPPTNEQTAAQEAYELWVAREIGGFLRAAPSVANAMSAEIIRANLRTCSQHLFRKGAKGRSFATIVGAPSSQVVGWLSNAHLVKLAPLMRISYRLGIPALDLLSSPELFSPDWSLVEENLSRAADDAGSTTSRRVIAIPNSPDPMPLMAVLQTTGYKSLRDFRNQSPGLHRELVVQHRGARRAAWQERMRASRGSTLAVIQEALLASLSLECPQVLTETALAFDFESSTRLLLLFPELCAAIIRKRAEWNRRQWTEKAAIAEEAARQEMPPTVESLATSLGCKSRTPIRTRFPSLVAGLAARFSERVNKRRTMVRTALGNALNEDPPLSIEQFAKRAGWGRCTLRRLFPETSRALQARHRNWKRQAARESRKALESEVARIVLDLHTSGIYPSYGRVGSLLPVDLKGAHIVEIVRHNREILGIPKHHAAMC